MLDASEAEEMYLFKIRTRLCLHRCQEGFCRFCNQLCDCVRKRLKLRYKRLLYAGYLVVVGNGTEAVIGRRDRVAASDWLLRSQAGVQ